MKKGGFSIRGPRSGVSAHVDNVNCFGFVAWSENVTPTGPTRGEDNTTPYVFGHYQGPTLGVPC